MGRIYIAAFILFPFFLISFVEMDFPAGDWVEKTAESQGVNPDKLEQAFAFLAQQSGEHKTDQAVLICNGYLIWKGKDIDHMHNVWSCSKSFTSAVLVLQIEDGI